MWEDTITVYRKCFYSNHFTQKNIYSTFVKSFIGLFQNRLLIYYTKITMSISNRNMLRGIVYSLFTSL
jgi:type II restriction/modification system DNA methylase subunit YeeA